MIGELDRIWKETTMAWSSDYPGIRLEELHDCWTNLLSTMITEWWIWKDVEGSGPGFIWGTISVFAWKKTT